MLVRLGVALVGCLLAAGCGEPDPSTQVIVVIQSDLPTTELDGFRTRVIDQDGEVVTDRPFYIGRGCPPVTLPADFAIGARNDDLTRRFTVEVVGLLQDVPFMTARATTGFVAGESLRLDLFLDAACTDVECNASDTCRAATCAPAFIDPMSLPVFPVPDEPAALGCPGGPPS